MKSEQRQNRTAIELRSCRRIPLGGSVVSLRTRTASIFGGCQRHLRRAVLLMSWITEKGSPAQNWSLWFFRKKLAAMSVRIPLSEGQLNGVVVMISRSRSETIIGGPDTVELGLVVLEVLRTRMTMTDRMERGVIARKCMVRCLDLLRHEGLAFDVAVKKEKAALQALFRRSCRDLPCQRITKKFAWNCSGRSARGVWS